MKTNRLVRIAGLLFAPVLVAGATTAQAAAATADGQSGTLYVNNSLTTAGSGSSCATAGYLTIQAAVDAADPWATVVVCPGTYPEQVVIDEPLTLKGLGATIDDTDVTPTYSVDLPAPLNTQTIYSAVVIVSSHVDIRGFTITGAQGEGVFAVGLSGGISDISVDHNSVVGNDTGSFPDATSAYFYCHGQDDVPDDCGEGVHFVDVSYSTIRSNYIANNSGGVLLTDDLGPTDHILVKGNVVTDNTLDCGITVPGHNGGGLDSNGNRQPNVAGVYDNVIWGNVVTGNGVAGEGAGVLFANGAPDSAVYDNLVSHNRISGNGLAGVTLHAHGGLPDGTFEDLSGNNIVQNDIGTNNVDGDTLDGPPGPSDTLPTGILVYSAGTPISMAIVQNFIHDNHYGIWLSAAVHVKGLPVNAYSRVTVRVSSGN
jgi:nitrous oxidase accessory protein NosD